MIQHNASIDGVAASRPVNAASRRVNAVHMAVLALCLCGLACDKTARSPEFAVTIDHFYDLYNNAGNRYWLVAREPVHGSIRALERVYPGAQKTPYPFQSDALSPDSLYEFSVLVQRVDGNVSMFVWQAVPHDGKLPFGSGAQSTEVTRLNSFTLNIADRPQLEDIQVVCENPGGVYVQQFTNEPNITVANAVSGTLGFFIRAKPLNDSWHSLWYTLPSGDINEVSLRWSDFQAETLEAELRFPVESDWHYTLTGVTPQGQVVSLAGHPQKSPEKFQSARFRYPPGIALDYCRLSAYDSKFGYTYDMRLPATSLLAPAPVDIKLQFNMSANGYLGGSPESVFDVLQAVMYGNQGKVGIHVTGPPAAFRYYPPRLPDSLGMAWFNSTAYSQTYTECIDFQELEGYQAWLKTDKTVLWWPAKLKKRSLRQLWTP